MVGVHRVLLALLIVFMVLEISVPSVAQNWLTDAKSGCKVQALYSGEGVTVLWSGPCEGGIADGKGTLTWLLNGEPGVVDTGNFLDGALEGKGARNHILGKWIYNGQFHGGKTEGKGRIVQENGTVYEGDWASGTQHGQGHYEFANGNTYNGGVVNGKKSGHGRLTFSDGTYFDGQFIDDYAEGDGKCKKDGHTGPCIFAHGTFVKWK